MVTEAAIPYSRPGLKIEKSIEYLTYGMILLFFTGKVFEVFTALIDILFITLLVIRKEKGFFQEHKREIILFGVLFVYFIMQSMFATYSLKALTNAVGMVRFVILMFALWYVFDSKEKVKRLLYSIYGLITILFVDAAFQFSTGKDLFGYPLYQGYRLTLWYEMPKLSEKISVLFGIVAAGLWITEKRKIAVLMMVLLTLMIVFAGNRGPVVYLIGSVFIIFLLSEYRKYLPHLIVGTVLLLAAVFAVNPKMYEAFKYAYTNPLEAKYNAGRTPIYEIAVLMIEDHPLLGIGSKNFTPEFHRYFQKIYDGRTTHDHYDEKYLTIPPSHTHSILLSMLLNWGLIGTLFLLFIFYRMYRSYIGGNRLAVLTLIGFIYAIAPFNFGKTVAHGQWQLFIFLSFTFALIVANNYKENRDVN